MLTRDAILAAQDLDKVRVEVPEWGEGAAVFVRTMTARERDEFERSMLQSKGKDKTSNLANIRARFAVLTMVDENGERYFEDGDAQQLGEKSAHVLDRIFSVAQKLNGMSADDVDELAGN